MIKTTVNILDSTSKGLTSENPTVAIVMTVIYMELTHV